MRVLVFISIVFSVGCVFDVSVIGWDVNIFDRWLVNGIHFRPRRFVRFRLRYISPNVMIDLWIRVSSKYVHTLRAPRICHDNVRVLLNDIMSYMRAVDMRRRNAFL